MCFSSFRRRANCKRLPCHNCNQILSVEVFRTRLSQATRRATSHAAASLELAPPASLKLSRHLTRPRAHPAVAAGRAVLAPPPPATASWPSRRARTCRCLRQSPAPGLSVCGDTSMGSAAWLCDLRRPWSRSASLGAASSARSSPSCGAGRQPSATRLARVGTCEREERLMKKQESPLKSSEIH